MSIGHPYVFFGEVSVQLLCPCFNWIVFVVLNFTHWLEWLSSVSQQTTSAGEDVKKGDHFCTVGGNAGWCRYCGKQLEIPQKGKNGTALRPSNSTSGNLSKET